MGHCFVLRHLDADCVDAVAFDHPHAHRARAEAGLARLHDGTVVADVAALEQRLRRGEQLVGSDSVRARDGLERARLQRKIALQQADGFNLQRGQRRQLGVAVRFIRVAASFELLERGQRTDGIASRFIAEKLDSLVEAEGRRRRDGDREPEIEIVVAPVILGNAGMRVDGRSGFVDAVGIDFRGDETGTVAEGARIELGGEVAHEAVALQPLDAFDDFFFRHIDRLPDQGERRRNQRNLILQGTQQLTVPLIDFLHLDPRLLVAFRYWDAPDCMRSDAASPAFKWRHGRVVERDVWKFGGIETLVCRSLPKKRCNPIAMTLGRLLHRGPIDPAPALRKIVQLLQSGIEKP